MALALPNPADRLPHPNHPCFKCHEPLLEKVCQPRECDHMFHFACIKQATDRNTACPLCNKRVTILDPTTHVKLPWGQKDECSLCHLPMEQYCSPAAEDAIIKSAQGQYYHEDCFDDAGQIAASKVETIAAKQLVRPIAVKGYVPPVQQQYRQQPPAVHAVHAAPVAVPLCDDECIEFMLALLAATVLAISFSAFYINLIVFDLADPQLHLLSIPFYCAVFVGFIAMISDEC